MEVHTPFNFSVPTNTSEVTSVAARQTPSAMRAVFLCSPQQQGRVLIPGPQMVKPWLRGHTTLAQGYSANKLGLEPNPSDSKGLVLATGEP